MRRLLLLAIVATLFSSSSRAQAPTFEAYVGHAFGDRVTQTFQIQRYLERLADTSDRVTVEQIGRSWEGRPLMLAIVTAPENHARLDDIQRTAQRLGDPRRLSQGEEGALIRTQPTVVWLGGSIHGFELSGTEGLLMLLEHLATREDAATLEILRNTVILIDPVLNPDGRDAFAHHNHHRTGSTPNPSLADWNNDFTSWEALSFRTGHYFFDINRDWFAHTQAETPPRVRIMREWRPQVGVDAHEMGSDVEFFFDPPTDPVGPYFPEYSSRWFERFGEAHARAFDAAGIDYMMGERFNYFFPGYTTSYLSYQGAVGMLYEQGSSRGLAIERPDGTTRTLGDAAFQQYTAALAAVRLAATEREALLRDYVSAHRDAIADGERGARRYLIDATANPQMAAELAAMLARNGVEVGRLTQAATLSNLADRTGANVGSRSFEVGTFVVEAAQPRNRLIRVLMEPHIPVPEAFLEEARVRVDRSENPRFYDITAWSLPLLFNAEAFGSADGRSLTTELIAEEIAVPQPPLRQAAYAYLFDGSQTAVPAALFHLRERGHRVAMLTKPTRLAGQDYASGTGIVYIGEGQSREIGDVHSDVREVARDYRLAARPVDSGMADRGHPSLGSGDVIYLRAPRIAILAEEPVHAYSFGWAWHALDQQYRLPTTVLRTRSLGGARLSDYDTIVLPAVTDTTSIPRAHLDRLARWVREGGTLITIGSATELARGPLRLIALREWREENALPVATPGAFVRTDIDREVWLSAGYDGGFPALVQSDRVYLTPDGPPSSGRRSVVRYATDEMRIAGHLWTESEERLPSGVFLYEERVGRGRVIAFSEDPNFRGYWRGADRLFLNAVVFGPNAP
ncbi:M14 family zinc carboxypeptidase [soil metagenome]